MEDLLRNLPPLLAATSRDTDEVIVVDNDSSDLTSEVVPRLFPEVRLIRAGSNLGFGGAVNLAAAQARGRTLLVLNPDVRMRTGDIDALVATVERTGGVAGPVLYLPSSGKRIYGTRYDLMGLPIESSRPTPAFYVQGCALAIATDLFRRIGGFDERYFLFAEDGDLCWRAAASGFPVDVVLDAEAVHSGGASEPGGYVKDGARRIADQRFGLPRAKYPRHVPGERALAPSAYPRPVAHIENCLFLRPVRIPRTSPARRLSSERSGLERF